ALLQVPNQSDVEQALDALAAVGLAEHWRRPAPNLSGGERQLAMLARALAQQPRVLLLDEPTSHLDLSNRGRVLAILRRLVDRGVTIIFTTHDPNLAFSLADQVILMRKGEVLAAGPAAATLTAANLSDLYGTSVEVHGAGGHTLIWAE
ncbi:MAG: ABC transporter ATP-binding protein, partial [Caldilinea sp.]